jgi:hypothetical protein
MIDDMCGWLFVVGEGNAIGVVVVVVVVVVREGGCYCERSGWAKVLGLCMCLEGLKVAERWT